MLKFTKSFWKAQFQITIATSIPFFGIFILELFTENLIKGAYESLEKPKASPPFWVFSLPQFQYEFIANLIF